MRWVSLYLVVVLMSAGLAGCDAGVKEPPECARSRQAVRELLRGGKTEAARNELKVAEHVCSQPSDWDVRRLSDLVQREERQRRLQAERLEQETLLDRQQPLRPFLRWAKSVLATNKERLGKVNCAPRGTPDFGFCTASVESASSTPFKARYLANNSNTFRLEWELPFAVTCEDFGSFRSGPHRTTPAGTHVTLCELTDHAFTGITALILGSEHHSRVVLFPDRYLEADPEFRKFIDENR